MYLADCFFDFKTKFLWLHSLPDINHRNHSLVLVLSVCNLWTRAAYWIDMIIWWSCERGYVVSRLYIWRSWRRARKMRSSAWSYRCRRSPARSTPFRPSCWRNRSTCFYHIWQRWSTHHCVKAIYPSHRSMPSSHRFWKNRTSTPVTWRIIVQFPTWRSCQGRW